MTELITPSTLNEDVTLVYSKNNCVKCKQTKMLMERSNIPYKEVNIEESGLFEEYIDMLKDGDDAGLAMPVVVPAQSTQLERWNDFRPTNIKALALAQKS